jgi:hypothetical protein
MRAPDESTRRRRDVSNLGGRLKRLSDLGDPLLDFSAAARFAALRTGLEQALACSHRSRRGPLRFDAATTVKILAIQAANTQSDGRTAFLIDEAFGRRVVSPGSAERSDLAPGRDTLSASARSPS